MEKISWTDRVRNEDVLHRVKEERNIVHTIKHVIEGKLEGRMEVTGRRGRRCKQLLDDLKEKRR
jgi:L-serine deaminase